MGRKSVAENSWLACLMDRKSRRLVAIALANKMERQIWAMREADGECRQTWTATNMTRSHGRFARG